jgi:predicted TPR repeat methyltransferase
VSQNDLTTTANDGSIDRSRVAFEQALELHAGGDYVSAVELYGDISPNSPAFHEGQHFLGIALHHLGQYEQAVNLLRSSLAATGGRIDWANNLGNILNAQGRFDEAVDVFERAVAQAPNQALLWINLGATQDRLAQFEKAEHAYQTAITIEPQSQQAYSLLSSLYERQKMQIEAVRTYCSGYIVAPRETTTPYLLGKAYYVLGRLDEAAEVYRQWKQIEPDNPIPSHLYVACSRHNNQDEIPERCSEDYVNVTFDEYADHFEGKLSQLDYRGPALLEEIMARHFSQDAALNVLDAGCGTGLCAPILRPYAGLMTGVDLSGSMLELARQRGLYEALHKMEIGTFLKSVETRYDLIACMDTLIYFGVIDDLFAQFSAKIKPEGWLIFTTEIAHDETRSYQLNPSGRYSHTAAYLRKIMEKHGFECQVFNHETLRTELQVPVGGVIVLAQRR